MNNWVSKMGFPVVSISETDKKGVYQVSQRRFFSSGEPTAEEDEAIWTINLGICSSNDPEKITYVDVNQKSQLVTYELEDDSTEWVKFNAGQSGFYRVQYSPALSERVAASVKSGSLSASDRLGLGIPSITW
jgi:aminopeptidase 2